jgi:hypothetical protein
MFLGYWIVSASWLMWTVIFISLTIMIYHFYLGIIYRRNYRHSRARNWSKSKGTLFRVIRKLVMVPPQGSISFKERQQLLQGSGWRFETEYYYLAKRLSFICALLILLGTYFVGERIEGIHVMVKLIVFLLSCIVVLITWLDKPILQSIMKQRRQGIIRDVYAINRQLLYYCGSNMNLHGKLVRCLPYAKSIRNELYLLTNEWYQDSEMAIRFFKERLGTEEGYSFAETLNSLRLHENDRYYELLKQRIEDYKEKLELFKEGRRETVSYVLFILAGLPILYTFRLFVYPWVAEGHKLFESLG